MALSQSKLNDELLAQVFDPADPTIFGDFEAIGEAWGDAVSEWWGDAQDCNLGAPGDLAAATAAFVDTLKTLFSLSTDPATTSANFGLAVEAYWADAWLAPAQAAVAPVGVIGPILLSQWANVINTPQAAAAVHSQIIHQVATGTPPPGVTISVPAIPCSGIVT